jgi:hypothetical protein
MSIRRAQDERIEGTPDGISAISEIMDVPDAPTIGTATDGGNVDASVTFTAATTGGTPASYTVTSTPGSITGTGSSSPVTVSGLTAGTAYTFKVKAANAAGTFGPESSASNSVTPAMPIPGAYYSLATTTLASAASTITFTGIPSGYKHLQLRCLARTTASVDNDTATVTFNSDVSANYSSHNFRGNGGVLAADGGANASATYIQRFAGGNQSASLFGAAIVDIFDYASTTKYKVFKDLGGYDFNGTGNTYLSGGLWMSTNPIISITMTPSQGGNWAQYSSFALYGVK